MSHERPSSSHPTRPESPRRPSPVILDPLPPRPPSAASSRNALSPRAPSPSSPGPNRAGLAPGQGYEEQMNAWLATHMPPALQSGLNSWCQTHAQPLLAGFLEQWMNLNAAQLTQNLLAHHLGPMQQALQQQQTMIAELQATVTTQAAKIAAFEARLVAQPAAASTNNARAGEPAPFMPTLPFALGGSPVVPASSTPPQSSGGAASSDRLGSGGSASGSAAAADQPPASFNASPSGRGLGLGLKAQRPQSASSRHSLPGQGMEDGVEAPIDPRRHLLNKSFASAGGAAGVPRINLADNSTPARGETIASEEKRPSPGAVPRAVPGKVKQVSGPVDVLVVDDLAMARKIAHAALTRAHYKVDLAEDGLTAIDLFKQHMAAGAPPQAVLMDIHMPGLSGIEATEKIRKMEQEARMPPVKIYGLTGDVAEDDLVKYKACGMNGCIQKGNLLADAVKQAMEQSAAGVQFVNLCGKQGSNGAASASAVANATSARAQMQLGGAGGAAGVDGVHGEDRPAPKASATERIRAEGGVGQAAPPTQFGTPRAPQPRVILGDKYQGHGVTKPGIGLGHARDGSSDRSLGLGSPDRGSVAPPALTGPNCLLVEDVRVSRRVASKALTNMPGQHFKVVEAEDGEEAVEKYRQHAGSIKYIIMDINLPGISGIEATEQIRSFEKSHPSESVEGGAIILGLTGNVDPESMRQYEICGMNGCILKGKPLTDAVSKAIDEASEGKFVNIS